ncbi:MAG: hypothetical protein GF329_10440, partial [Candidatus Lokiarchaeota archaeon]|nr:hypothetical protein [Candidatus Lokiarchaeota archaeon]
MVFAKNISKPMYPKNKKQNNFKRKSKPLWKKILYYSAFLLIADRLFFYLITYIIYNFNYDSLSFLEPLLNNLLLVFEIIFAVIIILVIFAVSEYFRLKQKIPNPKFLLYEIAILVISLSLWIVNLLSYYNVIASIFIVIINNMFWTFLEWLLKILMFFWPWIAILAYYFFKNFYKIGRLNYSISNFEVKSFALIFGINKRVKHGISILEIKNIPKDISIREKRIKKKNIERIIFYNKIVYFHYHLTVLKKYIDDLSYEISIHRNRVRLRIILGLKNKKLDELIRDLKDKMEVVAEVFQTSFPGLTFELLNGSKLTNAWAEIIGGIGDYKLKTTREDTLKIIQNEKDLFLKVISIKDKPQVKAGSKRTQIDNLISSLLGSNIY